MKQYSLIVEFIEEKRITVKANSVAEAKEIVYDKINSGDYDDFEETGNFTENIAHIGVEE